MMTNELAALIRQNASAEPHAVALQLDDRHCTWETLQTDIERFAHHLHQQGVGTNSRVLVIGRTQWEVLHLYLSCLWLGAVAIVVNRFPQSMLAEIAKQVGATHYYALSDDDVLPSSTTLVRYNYSCPSVESVLPTPMDIASVVLSSGSTGAPKAVAHNAKAHIHSAQGVCELMQWRSCDNALLTLPLYHVSGLGMVWRWLVSGSCLSISDKPQTLSIPVTVTSMVATQLQRWLAKPYASPIKILLGGSYIDPNLVEQARLQGASCYVGYAMTEMASTICAKAFDGQHGVGQALASREVTSIDGEVVVRGPMLAKGVFVDGALTPLATKDGWYLTNDLGHCRDGQWFIAGRRDNAFISGGESIHCEEIESALLSTGDFAQVLVVAVEDDEFGFRPVALYTPSHAFSRKQTEQKLQTSLIKFKWPIDYYLIPPSMLSGVKLNRKQLTQWVKQQRQQALKRT